VASRVRNLKGNDAITLSNNGLIDFWGMNIGHGGAQSLSRRSSSRKFAPASPCTSGPALAEHDAERDGMEGRSFTVIQSHLVDILQCLPVIPVQHPIPQCRAHLKKAEERGGLWHSVLFSFNAYLIPSFIDGYKESEVLLGSQHLPGIQTVFELKNRGLLKFYLLGSDFLGFACKLLSISNER